MRRYKTVDDFIKNAEQYQPELERLREILNSTKLEEDVKWGMPVYTYNGKNVVGIGGFKSYFGLWFFEGASLKDDANVLMNAQPGKTIEPDRAVDWQSSQGTPPGARPDPARARHSVRAISRVFVTGRARQGDAVHRVAHQHREGAGNGYSLLYYAAGTDQPRAAGRRSAVHRYRLAGGLQTTRR